MVVHCQVAFLPWAGLNTSLRLGPVTFWPFKAEADHRITDQAVKEYFERYFASYVDHDGRRVATITICAHGPDDFRQLDKSERRDIRRAVDALLFVSVLPNVEGGVRSNNSSWPQTNTETFELLFQNFQPGSDYIAVRAGNVTHTGLRLNGVRFPMPWCVIEPFGAPDSKLLKAFDYVFAPEFSEGVRDRLFHALEWFRLAHVASDDVSPFAKVVMMMTAFEILLQLQEPEKGKEEPCDKPKMGKRGAFAGKVAEVVSEEAAEKAAAWAKAFYDLRGKIVHGGPTRVENLVYRDWITHLIVADLVFGEVMVWQLFQHGCLDENLDRNARSIVAAFGEEPQDQDVEEVKKHLRYRVIDSGIEKALERISRATKIWTISLPPEMVKGVKEVAKDAMLLAVPR